MHSGTLISDLTADVDKVFARCLEAREDRRLRENKRLCSVCHTTLGEHSHDLWECPNPDVRLGQPLYRKTRFQELRCQAAVGSGENVFQCEKEVVEGSEMCEGHTNETDSEQ